jgi:hypothetical protein
MGKVSLIVNLRREKGISAFNLCHMYPNQLNPALLPLGTVGTPIALSVTMNIKLSGKHQERDKP